MAASLRWCAEVSTKSSLFITSEEEEEEEEEAVAGVLDQHPFSTPLTISVDKPLQTTQP
jgi:hypothetical protein